MDSSTVIFAAAALLVAAVAWKLVRGGLGDATYAITVRGDGPEAVDIRGKVPGKDDADVRDFVARMELPAGAKLWAIPDGARLTLRFNAKVPDNLQQRARNYFYN